MTVKIALNPNQIQNLDLLSLETIIQDYQSRSAIAELEQALRTKFNPSPYVVINPTLGSFPLLNFF